MRYYFQIKEKIYMMLYIVQRIEKEERVRGRVADSCFVLFNTIAMIGVSYTFLVLVHLLGIWAARGRFTNPKSMEILMENSAAQICLAEMYAHVLCKINDSAKYLNVHKVLQHLLPSYRNFFFKFLNSSILKGDNIHICFLMRFLIIE